MQCRIGVDLGGTKIEAVALGPSGEELARQRVPTPSGDYDATVGAIAGLVDAVEREIGAMATVGIGMPGTLSPATGLVKNSNSTCLNGRRLDLDLERRLDRTLRFANDANCFALSEATDGAAAGAAVVFGVILGTGVGGGIVVNGSIVTGANAIGGEWGHNPLPWPRDDERPGAECYCGQRGCLETFLSGPALEREGERRTGAHRRATDLAETPDGAAIMDDYVDRLARALATVINVVDPNVIVLGGGLSNITRLYEDVPRCWSEYVFSDEVATRLVRAQYGDSSGVRGAAWLWGSVD